MAAGTTRGPASRRIGVFGGTFDPPHIGHLVTAMRVAEALELDVVLMVVANVPWQKVGSRTITPADVRLDMVRAAVEGRFAGGMRVVGLADDGVDYVHEGPHAAGLPEDVKKKVEVLRADVVAGRVVVPSR